MFHFNPILSVIGHCELTCLAISLSFRPFGHRNNENEKGGLREHEGSREVIVNVHLGKMEGGEKAFGDRGT